MEFENIKKRKPRSFVAKMICLFFAYMIFQLTEVEVERNSVFYCVMFIIFTLPLQKFAFLIFFLPEDPEFPNSFLKYALKRFAKINELLTINL